MKTAMSLAIVAAMALGAAPAWAVDAPTTGYDSTPKANEAASAREGTEREHGSAATSSAEMDPTAWREAGGGAGEPRAAESGRKDAAAKETAEARQQREELERIWTMP